MTLFSSQIAKKRKSIDFVPRQSRRVSLSKMLKAGDGDTWVEHIVIVDNASKKTRSYYKSEKTQKRVWDEPPSGAMNVVHFPSF